MADFIEAAQLNQIPPGTSIMVRVADKDVALFNLDGAVYAISDTCAHQGSSLAAGELEEKLSGASRTDGNTTLPRAS